MSPKTWEDRNDAYYLEKYGREMKFQSVVAICFSGYRETYHHWRVFSSGSSGVCIEFDRAKLLQSIPDSKDFRHGDVKYELIENLKKDKPALETWPFLKRKPFADEREYRIIFQTKTEDLHAKSIPVQLAAIRKVTLSPWLPEPVAKSVVQVIRSIDGCAELNVNRSSLIDNAGWRSVIE